MTQRSFREQSVTLVEQKVGRHYTHGSLERAILDALRASGKNIERLSPSDFSSVDEFHLGWRAATTALAANLSLESNMHVLDVGSGIGGPARYFAENYGCRVTGIDITKEFVSVAGALTRRCGLADVVSFCQASTLAIPFADATFDAAVLIHVGMNVANKGRLFREVRRVLKFRARFGVYDVVDAAGLELPFPMPWAASPETSFLEPADAYRQSLEAAGFRLESQCDRSDLTMRLVRKTREDIPEHGAKHGVPPLGLHVLIGPEAPQRLGNMMHALENGMIAPVEFMARAV